MKKIIFLLLLLFSNIYLFAQNFKTEIYLNDGKSLNAGYIMFSNGELLGSPFLATDPLGLDRIYAKDIDYVNIFNQTGTKARFEIIPWGFFRIWAQAQNISDRITIYNGAVINQFYADPLAYNNLSDRNIIAFKKDDGNPQRIIYKNLKKELADNLESKIYLKKVKNQTILQVVAYAVGATLIGLGVRETYKQAHGEAAVNITKVTGFYLGGASGVVIPLMIRPLKRNNMYKALKAY